MTKTKKQILIVDDSPEDIQFVMENLKNDYAVLVATDGKKAIEIAEKEPRPDVILMDVMMPEMNGYDTCRMLKMTPATSDIAIIFVSARDTVEEKLAGYDAGGNDYLIKPVQPVELLEKIRMSIEQQEARKQHAEVASTAFETAMTALSSAGEQGVVIQFLRDIIAVNDIAELGNVIIDSMKTFSLNVSCRLQSVSTSINASSVSPIPPLEAELLERTQMNQRIMEFGSRTIMKYGGVTLLIKNMPEEEEKRGRYRDHIAILLEAADEKLCTLKSGLIVQDIYKTMKNIEAMKDSHKASEQKLLTDMLEKLEKSFDTWELTEPQENRLTQLYEEIIDRAMGHFVVGQKYDTEIMNNLELLMTMKGSDI